MKSETGVKTAFPCKAKENPRKTKNSKFFPWCDLKGRLRRKSRKTWDLNDNKGGMKIWVTTPQEHQNPGVKTRELLDEAFATSEISTLTSQLSWSTDGFESPDEMLHHSTPRRPQEELRRIRVGSYPAGVRSRSLTLDALNMAARIVTLETPSPMVARRRAQENVRRTLMEKSLEAVIEEAKMELRQEQETPEKSPVYQNVDFNYENENFNEEEHFDFNSNCTGSKHEHSYQNLDLSAFYENIDIQNSFGQHSYEIIGFPSETRRLHILAKNYEDMDCKVLSETYVEMTPVKSKLVTAV